MSLRAVSEQVAKEILEAWFSTSPSNDPEDIECLKYLNEAEGRHMVSLRHQRIDKSEKE